MRSEWCACEFVWMWVADMIFFVGCLVLVVLVIWSVCPYGKVLGVVQACWGLRMGLILRFSDAFSLICFWKSGSVLEHGCLRIVGPRAWMVDWT